MKRFATYYPYEQKLMIEGQIKLIQEEAGNERSIADLNDYGLNRINHELRLAFGHIANVFRKKVILIGLGVGVVGLLIPTSKLFLYPISIIIGKACYHVIDGLHHNVDQHIHNFLSIDIGTGHYITTIDSHHTPNSSLAKEGNIFLEKIDGKMTNHFKRVKDFLDRNQ